MPAAVAPACPSVMQKLTRIRRCKKEPAKVGQIFISVTTVILAAYVGMGLVLFFSQSRLLFHPAKEIDYSPQELGIEFEEVFFEAPLGVRLSGWYIPGSGSGPTVLFCHGNAGNMGHRLDSINFFNELGLSCFIFDYRGYGKSSGKPTEQGTYLDAAAAYKWLTDERKTDPANVIIFGRSLGASVAAHLASRAKACGVVLESGFTSYVDMGRRLYPYMPVRVFARFRYSTIEYIKGVTVPVMIIHSRDDEIVPFEFGQQLYEAANEPREFVEISGSHNDGFVVSEQFYRNAWKQWLKKLARPETRKASRTP